MKLKGLMLAGLLGAAPAFAAEIDGTWTGSIDTPNGPVPLTYVFKSEGNRLTGTAPGPNNSELPILEGRIEGDTITYALDLDFGQGPMRFHYTGVLSSGELKVRSEFMGMPVEFTLKKAS